MARTQVDPKLGHVFASRCDDARSSEGTLKQSNSIYDYFTSVITDSCKYPQCCLTYIIPHTYRVAARNQAIPRKQSDAGKALISLLLVCPYSHSHKMLCQHLASPCICVGKLTIIGSDNGLLPGRRQAIIWTNDGILLIPPLGTNFS